jgi:hypothetical protein
MPRDRIPELIAVGFAGMMERLNALRFLAV